MAAAGSSRIDKAAGRSFFLMTLDWIEIHWRSEILVFIGRIYYRGISRVPFQEEKCMVNGKKQ